MQFDKKNFNDIEPFLQKYHYPEEIEQLKKLDQPNQLKWLLSRLKMGDYGRYKTTPLKSYYWSVISEFPLYEYLRFYKKAGKVNQKIGESSSRKILEILQKKLKVGKVGSDFLDQLMIKVGSYYFFDPLEKEARDIFMSIFTPQDSLITIPAQLKWILDKIEKKEISPNSVLFADHFWINSLHLPENEKIVFTERALKLQLAELSNDKYADYILQKIFLNLPEEKLNIDRFQNSICKFSLKKIKRLLNKDFNPANSIFIDLQKNNKFVIKLKDAEYEIPFLLRIGLCKESHFFETLFNSSFRESLSKAIDLSYVHINQWNRFIACWQGKLEIQNLDEAIELFQLGHLFQICLTDCKDFIANFIKSLTKTTFKELENFANFFHQYDSVEIKRAIGFHLPDYFFGLINRKKAISQSAVGLISKDPSKEERLKTILQKVVVVKLKIGKTDEIVESSETYIRSIELIKRLPQLKELTFNFPITSEVLNVIYACKYLERLLVDDSSHMRDADIIALSSNLKYLKHLVLYKNRKITAKGYNTLFQLSGHRLNSLGLNLRDDIHNTVLKIMSMHHFPNLTKLSLRGFDINVSILDSLLTSLEHLESIDLHYGDLTDNPIQNGRKYTMLKAFYLVVGYGNKFFSGLEVKNYYLRSLLKKIPDDAMIQTFELR